MVSVEVKLGYLQQILGEKIREENLSEILTELGMELEDCSDGVLKIDITAERPDMVSAEGIARVIKYYTGKKPFVYKAKKSDYKVLIDKSVSKVRPYTACSVIKNLNIDEEKLKEIIWVQEKLHATYCRNRKKAAIGIYPMEKISFPIHYKALRPEEIKFVPLEFDKVMAAKEILKNHPTGRDYGYLLENSEKYPVFVDAMNNIMSMPPIINSELVGKVTVDTKDIFIECSGFSFETVSQILNILVTMFIDMGGDAYEISLLYPDKKRITPDLSMEKRKISVDFVNKILGVNLKPVDILSCLEKMGYIVDSKNSKEVWFRVQPYRTDIWHDVDIVDDIARAYGFNKFVPESIKVSTTGDVLFPNRLKRKVSEIMLGLGFSEVLTFSLTDTASQYNNMLIKEQPHVKLGFSADKSLNMVRTWLLPEVLKAFIGNRNKEFPQKIFEIEHVVLPDKNFDVNSKTVWRMCFAISDSNADFTRIRQPVEALFEILGIPYSLKEYNHSSFVPGRCAAIMCNNKELGFFGELHPQVLENFNIIMPTVACEIDFEELIKLIRIGGVKG